MNSQVPSSLCPGYGYCMDRKDSPKLLSHTHGHLPLKSSWQIGLFLPKNPSGISSRKTIITHQRQREGWGPSHPGSPRGCCPTPQGTLPFTAPLLQGKSHWWCSYTADSVGVAFPWAREQSAAWLPSDSLKVKLCPMLLLQAPRFILSYVTTMLCGENVPRICMLCCPCPVHREL